MPDRLLSNSRMLRVLLAALFCAVLLQTHVVAKDLPTGAAQVAPGSYADITPVHWASDAVRRMTALGVFTGYPDGTFDGNRQATRFELAVVAARLVDLLGGSLSDLISDPDFQRAVEDAAGNNARLIRLEDVTGNAANAAYVQELNQRVALIEEYLNQAAGERLFPGLDAATPPLHAVDTVGPLSDQAIASITSQLERQLETLDGSAATTAAAAADASTQRNIWFGISAGYPQVSTLHFGVRNLVDHLHLRFGVGFMLPDALNLELHALYEFTDLFSDIPLSLYLAAGPTAHIGQSGSAAALSFLGGAEYYLSNGPGSLFVELGPDLQILPSAGELGLTVRAGLNYRF